MKKEYRGNEIHIFLKVWYKDYQNNNKEVYYKIYGFLKALEATNFISENELKEAIDFLINIDIQKGESL